MGNLREDPPTPASRVLLEGHSHQPLGRLPGVLTTEQHQVPQRFAVALSQKGAFAAETGAAPHPPRLPLLKLPLPLLPEWGEG